MLPALAAVDVAALGTLRGVAVRTLTGGLHGDVDQLSVDLAATGLFLAAAWLGIGLLAGVAAAAPGAVGAVAQRLAHLVLPAVIRRVLAGSVGLGVLLTPVAAGAQAATASAHRPATAHSTAARPVTARPISAQGPSGPTTPTPTPSPSLPPPTWPTTPSPTSPPSGTPSTTTPAPSDTPAPTNTPPTTTPATPPATPAPTGPSTSTPSTARTTTVRAGDSLWMLAAQRLGAHVDDTEIDAYWRAIYRQNRAVIGDDPSLIRPGQHLTLPAPSAKESTR